MFRGRMSNVLDDDTQQQVRALGRLGWTLSRIQEATGYEDLNDAERLRSGRCRMRAIKRVKSEISA
jgi:hypothetical protein